MGYEEYKIKWKSVGYKYNPITYSKTTGIYHNDFDDNRPWVAKFKDGSCHGAQLNYFQQIDYCQFVSDSIELKSFSCKRKVYGEFIIYKK